MTEPEQRIGVDEWVAQVERRRAREPRPLRLLRRVPREGRLGTFVVVAALLPFMTDNEYVIRVGVDTLVFALLAVGLNVAVGFAGLLDLGYVAFYGIGAYTYAMLASEHFDQHWPAQATVPVVVVGTALVGLAIGLSARRLLGDYLAIVTLFFLQAFVVFTTNGNKISFLGFTPSIDLTGGPNGIPGIDPWNLFGLEIDSVRGYFYVGLATFVLVVVALHFASESRTGRAWKALREDPLAAELMGMPVNRLKLLAFVFGAAIAGLTGSINAALTTGVFPANFDLPLLITVYAMLILGGAGSLTGALLGAVTINVSLEVLRDPEQSRWLFYAVIVLVLLAKLRPWWRLAAVAGATVALGFVVRAVWPDGGAGEVAGGDAVARAVQAWVVHPDDQRLIGNIGFVALVGAVILLVQLRGLWRMVALVPALYLAAFVWENRLVFEPSVTRLILLGALLVTLMNLRPEGLLGTSRVEIV